MRIKIPFSRWKSINCSDPGIYARNQKLMKVRQEWIFWNKVRTFNASMIDGIANIIFFFFFYVYGNEPPSRNMRKRSTCPTPASLLTTGLQTLCDDSCPLKVGLCDYLDFLSLFYHPMTTMWLRQISHVNKNIQVGHSVPELRNQHWFSMKMSLYWAPHWLQNNDCHHWQFTPCLFLNPSPPFFSLFS